MNQHIKSNVFELRASFLSLSLSHISIILISASGILNSDAPFLPVDIMPACSVVGLFKVKFSCWCHACTSARFEKQDPDMSKILKNTD